MEIRGGVTRQDGERTTTMEDRATKPPGCWKAEFRNFENAFSSSGHIMAATFCGTISYSPPDDDIRCTVTAAAHKRQISQNIYLRKEEKGKSLVFYQMGGGRRG